MARSRAVDGDGLAEMLARAEASPLGEGEDQPQAQAPVAITIESFPGLCMGASMLASLSLHKIGYAALTKEEGDALTRALLKNAEAWDLGALMQNPKAAAAIDLLGVGVAILTPRIIADAKSKPATELQEATAAREEGKGDGVTAAP